MNQSRFQVRKPTKWPTIWLFIWRRVGGGGYGWFQKIISCRRILRGKNYCKEIPGEINSYTEKNIFHGPCISGKKFYSSLGEKNSYPKPNPALLKRKNGWPVIVYSWVNLKKKWCLRLPETEIAEFLTNWRQEMQECAKLIALLTLSTFWGVSARKKNICLYLETVPRKRPSLRGSKLVKNLEIFWMNNKAIIIEFGFRIHCNVKNCVDLGGCFPLRPNTLPHLHTSLHHFEPHSIIVILWEISDRQKRVDWVELIW